MPFPSPADDHAEKRLDITDLLMPHPASTYFMRVSGDAMIGDGIGDRDTVVIDRALAASDQSIIVARLGTRFTLRRLRMKDGRVWLQAANSAYATIEVTRREDFEVWGVVRKGRLPGIPRSCLNSKSRCSTSARHNDDSAA